ncbi:hypothetical protein BJ741DRAFT_574990 [Chytriomyces cf. hyalinus JEL632]|nr:hypothetical protein BJ741DRAFT_574990 [Chytriomyces cf. hyalinus JEL632]
MHPAVGHSVALGSDGQDVLPFSWESFRVFNQTFDTDHLPRMQIKFQLLNINTAHTSVSMFADDTWKRRNQTGFDHKQDDCRLPNPMDILFGSRHEIERSDHATSVEETLLSDRIDVTFFLSECAPSPCFNKWECHMRQIPKLERSEKVCLKKRATDALVWDMPQVKIVALKWTRKFLVKNMEKQRMDGKACAQNAPTALPMTTDSQELSSHSQTPGFMDAPSLRGSLESNTFERESRLRSFQWSNISQAGVESAAAPVQDYRWTQHRGPIVFYGGTRSAAALNSTHTLYNSRDSLMPSSSGSPPPFLLLQSAHYEVEEEPEEPVLVSRSYTDAFVLGGLAGELSGESSYLESCSLPSPIFSSVFGSVSDRVTDMPAPHFAGTSAYALQHVDSLAEMQDFLALMDTWPTGPDFPHRNNWLLEPCDILDDEPYNPEEAQFGAESEPVFSTDGYSISYLPSSLLSSASPYSLSAYPASHQAQDYFMGSRDQARNLPGCGAGISPNPFARPKGMGEHHMLPMESNVADACFQTAADQCELEIEEETEAEERVDPQEDASCPSTVLHIEPGRLTARDDGLLSAPKDQHCGGIFNWIQGLFSCFGSQGLPPVGISSVAPATITVPLSATPATNYGTGPAVVSTGFFVGLFNGESDGNFNGVTAAPMSKRRYLHWLCDGSDFD